MKVSYEWLREYVDTELSPEELSDLLSMSGTEVERLTRLGSGVSGVVVARVAEVKPHPNADKLLLAVVDDGTVERTVVCGAPNLREGMVSALAVAGARLPEVTSGEFKSATIRGVKSDGMLLSAAELGISDDHSGILELEPGTQAGLDIHDVLPLDDAVLDLEITPNRPDCMSMVGIAREVSAVTGAPLRMPDLSLDETGGPVGDLITIRIEDTEGCPRYTARAVTGVAIAPSPPWMQRRLVAAGLRPISNVVDITNYVLLETGQPLHAFDMDLLGDRTIIVRRAGRGEPITTLDGVDRQLDELSLVIADSTRPVALAGIIGGEDSEVREETTNILIESAYFNPTSILLTSNRLGIRTEASGRFERGSDPGGTRAAADRAAKLMAELAEGSVASGVVDEYPAKVTPVEIELRPARVNRLLGTDIPKSEMVGILERLQAGVREGEPLVVEPPTFRPDLEREVDLIEEIARVFGYDRIPAGLPGGGGVSAGATLEDSLRERLGELLVSLGLCQVITYSFMRPGDLDLLRLAEGDEARGTLTIINPLAETGEAMRTTMLPGLLRAAAANINRGNRDLALFEAGRVFIEQGEGLPREIERVGILLCGLAAPAGWSAPERDADYFDLKGIVEDAVEALGVEGLDFVPAQRPFLAPGRSAAVVLGESEAGFLGLLHPSVASDFGLDQEVFVCEFDSDPVIGRADPERAYVPVGRFPNVKVDIAVVVDEPVEARLVEKEIAAEAGDLLRSVRLFDVYRGPQVPDGRKSLAYALEFGSAEGTLTDEMAHARMDMVIDALKRRFGAAIRGRDSVEGEAT